MPPARPILLGTSVLALLLAACGPDAEPSADASPHFYVADRTTRLVALPTDPAPPALSRTWTFDDDDASWQVEAPGRGTREDGRLTAFSLDSVAVVGPSGTRIDPELQHWLVIEASPSDEVESLRVQWRAADEAFGDDRSTSPMPLAHAGNGPGRYAIPMASLRGTRGGRDASAGVAAFRLVFGGAPGSRPRVQIDAINLVSDYDGTSNGPLTGSRPEHLGEARDGAALRLPGRARAEFVASPGERLRLGLALAGSNRPVLAVLRAEADGLVVEQQVELLPGAAWRDVRLDLASLAGRSVTLELSADPTPPADRGVAAPDTTAPADPGAASPSSDATLLVSGLLRLVPEDAPGRPDVLLYVEDTLRADRLGTFGYPFATDPTLARIASEGTRFARVQATSSWTRPSTSSLLTSLDPLRHGNRTHLQRVPDDVVTLAEALAADGYLTASFVTNYHAGAWSGLDQGFDQAREPTADDAGRIASTLTSSAIAPSIEAFLQEHRDERVFVSVHSLDPHEPYAPEAQDEDALASTRAQRPRLSAPRAGDLSDDSFRYDAEIRHNDRMLQRLDEALLRLGLRGRTLFAFTSDHGEAFGEHGQVHHRQSLFQEELAVPLVLRGPGVPRERTIDTWTSLLDLAPTLAGLAGAPIPESWQGRDLSPLLRGEVDAPREVPLLSHVIFDEARAGHLEELALVQDGRKLVAAVTADGQLVPRALYDLRSDPGERRDLLADADADARRIADALLAEGQQRITASRASDAGAAAAPMDPALREWMIQMGYLQDDRK